MQLEAIMAFYDTPDFIEAFRNGGCFIFEGEDGTEEPKEDSAPEETEETSEEPSEEPAEKPQDGEQQQDQPPPAPPEAEPPASDDVKAADPDAVNTDDDTQGKQTLTADEIVKEFKESGALQATLKYAMSHINGGKVAMQEGVGGKQTITLRTLLPYVKAGVEKFCQKQTFSTSVAEMAKAVMQVLKSLSTKEVQKEKMKAAEAKKQEEKKQAEEQQQKQPQEQSAPAQDAGGEAPAEAPSGGEEAPAPTEGDAEEATPPEN